MAMVFIKLLNMSISAGWLILAVVALRFLLQKTPKWLSCTLWAVVAVRLICPFSFESAFSLIPSAETVSPAVVRYAPEPSIDSGIPAIDDMLNPMISESFAPAPGASVNPLDIWAFAASIIWVIGLVVMLGYAVVSFLRLRGKVREAIPLQNHVWICDAVKSPFILGIVRPRIYLSSGMDTEQMRYVLAHEQAHLKRGDHVWKPLGYALLAVYWFHPLIWAAYALFCQDIEFACDEKAVKDMNFDGKKAYCHALLSCSMPRGMRVSYPLAFGEGRVKERVKHVLHYRRPAFWAILAAAGVCVAVAVCFLTDPKTDAPYDDEFETSNTPYDNEIGTTNSPHNDDGTKDTFEETQPPFGELISINRAESSHDPQAMFRTFGISIQLPGNSTWIQNVEYSQPDQNHMEINYHDAIINADCQLLSVRDGMLDLPDITYDKTKEELWQGTSSSGQVVYVKVQRSADGTQVLATWEYEEYQFALLADVPADYSGDIGAIAKAALSVISNI